MKVGTQDGTAVGTTLGEKVGIADGIVVGVIEILGRKVGLRDGIAVGLEVGINRYSFWTLLFPIAIRIDPSECKCVSTGAVIAALVAGQPSPGFTGPPPAMVYADPPIIIFTRLFAVSAKTILPTVSTVGPEGPLTGMFKVVTLPEPEETYLILLLPVSVMYKLPIESYIAPKGAANRELVNGPSTYPVVDPTNVVTVLKARSTNRIL
jgi:hypothetical protein